MSFIKSRHGIAKSIVLFTMAIGGFCQTQGIRLQSITINDGLSASSVRTINQDIRGYIWFGTANGLNRYDGHEIKVYKYDPDDFNSISNNDIRCIVEDKFNRLWIGTDAGGLNVFDMSRETFKKINLPRDSKTGLTPLQIWDLSLVTDKKLLVSTWGEVFEIDLTNSEPMATRLTNEVHQIRTSLVKNEEFIWFGCENEGLYSFTGSKFTRIKELDHIRDLRIHDLIEEDNGVLWIATDTGLLNYDPSQKKVRRIALPLKIIYDPEEITTLAFGPDKKLWAGTSEHGLISFDTKTEEAFIYRPIPGDPNSLKQVGIQKIFFDTNNLLWITTLGNGVQIFNPQTPFRYFGFDPQYEGGLNDPSIRAILSDENGLWIGGYDGLIFFAKKDNSFTHYKADKAGLSNDNVYSLMNNGTSSLWIGTEGGGLFNLNKTTGAISKIGPYAGSGAASNFIFELFLAQDSSLYLGTGGGLWVLAPEDNYSKPLRKISLNDENIGTLDAVKIVAINADKKGNIYLGTESEGLIVISKDHEPIAQYVHDRNNRASISSNSIKVLHFDSDENLWIGTGGGGLEKWDPATATFFHYDESDGLSDNIVYGILEDSQGYLWLSTNKGISLFDKKEGVIRIFGIESGLQSLEFNTGAFYKSEAGEMFFGGIYGLNAFFPDEAAFYPARPSVVFTDFKVSNKSVPAGSSLLPEEINSLEEIRLSHEQMLVSFEFSGMDLLTPENTKYRYMLSGVDREWIYTNPGNRAATYTHLPAGKYVLHVQASSGGLNQFGEDRRLNLVIYPPPWNSWWARLLYLIIILAILYTIRKNELKKIGLKKELEQRKLEAQKLNEIDLMKSHLISNMSHGLKTPLTLLDGHLATLFKATKEQQSPALKKSLSSARSSLQNLTNISNQLFDLSQIASGKIKLRAREENLAKIILESVEKFKPVGQKKRVHMTFINHGPEISIYIDKLKFEQILYNLLSNAIAQSTKGGTVHIELMDDGYNDDRGTGSFMVVRVANTGTEIPPKALKKIFDRFYEEDSEKEKKDDIGIGLALTKELVELHGGTISVQSDPQGKTTFEFTIPKGSAHLYKDEILKVRPTETEEEYVPPGNSDPTIPKVLIVEDESSLRSFMCQALEESYTTLNAANGKEGLSKAMETLPSLIISEIYMPEMDGFEMLKRIRENPKTKGIPVIMFTGRNITENRIKSFKVEANGFMTKPFTVEELHLQIKNSLIQRQESTTEVESHGVAKGKEAFSLSRADEALLNRTKEVIEEKMDEPNLNVEELAKRLFVSKRQLERKLKEITGQSPAEFIRKTRLAQGRQYLLDGSFATVSEVSFAVGFKNVKYFSRLYKNQFGRTPSEIIKIYS